VKTAVNLLFLISLMAASAAAQISQGTFKHIIIVVQENRTPDNLFGSSPPSGATCESGDPFESGVDIDNGAPNKKQGQLNPTCNVSTPLANMCNPAHNHIDFVNECDLTGGACLMDGACSNASSNCSGTCPQYAYVPQSDVQQYFQIAETYGFANYMFQTNEGPSFPAHQFLFAGTSAPVIYNDPNDPCSGLRLPPCWTWFVADNPEPGVNAGDNTGCTAPKNQYLQTIDPAGTEQQSGYCTNNVGNPWCSVPCYERAAPNQQGQYTYGSLADVLQYNSISWRYYTPTLYTTGDTETIENGLWVAPISIRHFCQPGTYNNVYECTGLLNNGQYAANMRYETTAHPYPLVDDISNCSLAAVSWAIPDKRWSDHGGEDDGSGPFYVANIIDALGNNSSCADMINGNPVPYWQDTAIFIVWDDFGGWVDHVSPTPYPGVNRTGTTWGSGYTYGLRVPLLVVSAYTGILQNGTYSPYISGACGVTGQPSCPNNVAPYVHDFGSILAFIEWNFLGRNAIGTIDPPYPFADFYAPEWQQGSGTVPLLDFFTLTSPRQFVQIDVPSQYDVNYFQNYFTNNPSQTPDGPDADDD
jgi:phospholipase C